MTQSFFNQLSQPLLSILFPYTTLSDLDEVVVASNVDEAASSEPNNANHVESQKCKDCCSWKKHKKHETRNSKWTCQPRRSEEHTSELQSLRHLVCRLLLEKKKDITKQH